MWRLQRDSSPRGAIPEGIRETIRAVVAAGIGEIWLEHPDGPLLCVLPGPGRVYVMYLAEEGDAGYHAVDPASSPEVERGYVLSNGQRDEWPDCETVSSDNALPIVEHLLRYNERWPGVAWNNDGED
jgi:hypothetical protein